jgi:hypothetical protein
MTIPKVSDPNSKHTTSYECFDVFSFFLWRDSKVRRMHSFGPQIFLGPIICSYEPMVQLLASFPKIVRRPHFHDV